MGWPGEEKWKERKRKERKWANEGWWAVQEKIEKVGHWAAQWEEEAGGKM
jgi:hypothetical protein